MKYPGSPTLTVSRKRNWSKVFRFTCFDSISENAGGIMRLADNITTVLDGFCCNSHFNDYLGADFSHCARKTEKRSTFDTVHFGGFQVYNGLLV